MAQLVAEIVGEVVASCRAGAAEAAEAFGRALGGALELSVGEPGHFDPTAPPEGFSGPGLAIVFTAGPSAALLLLPERTGLVPEWCADPDATGRSKLSMLAQELGMALFPEGFLFEDFRASRVKSLSEALARGNVSHRAAMVPLELSGPGQRRGTAILVWPAAEPAAVIGSADVEPERKARPASVENLPGYSRSLLRIEIPVIVTLAGKRQALGQILELGPGSILHFDKSCEDMLDLTVGGRIVASGEAVKVGDKFGLRVTSIRLPEERFCRVQK